VILLLLSGSLLIGLTQDAYAQRGGENRGDRRSGIRDDRPSEPRVAPNANPRIEPRVAPNVAPRVAPRVTPRTEPRREFMDSRYQHERSYPARGQYVRALPRDNRVIVHGGVRYHFYGGVWYRPYGARFAIVAPPIGLFVPFLPSYFATIWIGGIPYYYANEVYYMHRGGGYVVVEPPKGNVSQAPPPVDQMFIYPREGQNEQQQADDRYQCHRWAVDQTGFDPTQPTDATPETRSIQKRADYQRAMGACLDGRGYTVK